MITKPRSHVTIAVAEASDERPRRFQGASCSRTFIRRRRRSALRGLRIAKEAGLA